MRRVLPIVIAVLVLLGRVGPGWTQPAGNDAPAPQRELVVGTKEAPPFAMKDVDGTWRGISIDLWRKVAGEMRLNYRFSESTTVDELLDAVAGGKVDVAVAALSVTGPRSRAVEFTSPFYTAGLGIAVLGDRTLNWLPVMTRTFISVSFAKAVLALLGLALVAGLLFWLFERKHHEDFGGGVAKGLSVGAWWATATMTRRGGHGNEPKTLGGRIVAILWAISSIIAIAVFTAAITSALTIRQLQGSVHGVGDLSVVRVGAVNGTSTQDALARRRIAYRTFPTPRDGLLALRSRSIDAFVYDRPLLAWLIRQDFPSLELVETSFDSEYYALALPLDSPLRRTINVTMLDTIQSPWWRQNLLLYLDDREH